MDQARYEVLDVIASGGMATVWRARDRRLGRLVAIKRPHPMPDGSDVAARFAREARAAATVSHPNLVSVYDSGEDDQGPYLVMEYVDGPSIAEAGVPAERAAAIGAEVAAGLAALHAAGIVHGDVKPGNILLADGRSRLTDFGIARSADDPTITRAGTTFGTPAYAAPETLRHGDRTPAADVYSLAAVVHELATGTRWSHDPSATAAMPAGPLAAALAPALAYEPERRPTAAAFASVLTGDASSRPPAATTGAAPTMPMRPATAPAPRSRAPFAALAVGGAVAVVIAAVLMLTGRDGGDVVSSNASVAAGATSAPVTTIPATAIPATTIPASTIPASTAPPTTVQPTTVPPTTSPPTTAPAAPDVALARLVEANSPGAIKPKEARDVVDRLERASLAAVDGDDGRVEEELRKAAEHLAKHVGDDDLRDEMVELLVEIADRFGVDPDEVVEPFEDDDEDDD